MQTLLTLVLLPLVCLLSFTIPLVVIIYFVFRNLHSKNISNIFSFPDRHIHHRNKSLKDEKNKISIKNRSSSTKDCPACGAVNVKDANQCDYCGTRFIGFLLI